MSEKILHTFEAGRRGKPDELDSGIANLIGASLLNQDRSARFDLRVSGTFDNGKPLVRVSGEISEQLLLNQRLEGGLSGIILDRYNLVHRTNLKLNEVSITYNLKPQAHSLASNGNAGDAGSPIAVACKDAPHHLPWERYLAVGIRDIIDNIYHNNGVVPVELATTSGVRELNGLRADGKVNANVIYRGSCLDSLSDLTLAIEHESSISIGEFRNKVSNIVFAYLKNLEDKHQLSFGTPEIDINGAGAWNKGGWAIDEGSREAKPYRDGFASHGCQEDSFSGEDPTKPSGTGTFIARYVAVQIVGNDLADYAKVTLVYKIGREKVGLNIVTNDTGKLSQEQLEALVRKNIPLRIKDGIEMFNLRDPSLYRTVVDSSDYFQNPNLPWNQVKPLTE
jgi:S-adenosylmethionine synthetase